MVKEKGHRRARKVYAFSTSKEMEHDQVEVVENENEDENMSEDESSTEDETTQIENKQNDKDMDSEDETAEPKVFLPGQILEDGEELVVDKTAYRMLHQAQSGAPCLSFDIIPDDLGNARESYPLTMYLVAGTQASKTHVNNLLIMKMSNLTASPSADSDEESCDEYDDENSENLPVMNVAPIKHQGCVNRVRCTRIEGTTLAASWSELGRVSIWDLNEPLKAVESSATLSEYRKKWERTQEGGMKPLFTFKGHLAEGYGIDWCPTEPGTLASGDCKGNIHIWRPVSNSGSTTWHVDQRPYNSHAPHSVEDLQWSPNERNVLCSCSVDQAIKIWDTRASPQSACMLTAAGGHTADINVISWNRKETQFLVSGGDDGRICVWDLRQFGSSETSPVATFKQHLAPVTTVEWHPEETTVFASGGSDDQIAQWDLSVEVDQASNTQENELSKLPPQLLFIHQGQSDIKELHWHPQCPGVVISTAHSGFNIFRTISV